MIKKILIKLIIFLVVLSACQKKQENVKLRVGFDVDDTLLFSTPAFEMAQKKERFGTVKFWKLLNSYDRKYSVVKKKTKRILEDYKKKGAEIFIITARKSYGGNELRKFIHDTYGVPEKNVFFEENKTARMKKLKLDIFYGDSDTDISGAIKAGVKPFRIERSPKSSYKNKDGTLKKYNPGKYKEKIVENSKE